jgi:hypothetical protein
MRGCSGLSPRREANFVRNLVQEKSILESIGARAVHPEVSSSNP